MNCQQANELLILDLYGEAASAESAELERHLAACAACRREAESARAVLEQFRREPSPQPARATIETILEATQPRPGFWESVRRLRPALWPAAAVAILALAIPLAIKFWPHQPPAPAVVSVAAATGAGTEAEAAWTANATALAERIRLARTDAGFDASLDYRIAGLHDSVEQSRNNWQQF